jgi:hypothetical protein
MRCTVSFVPWVYENYGDYNGQYFYVEGEGKEREGSKWWWSDADTAKIYQNLEQNCTGQHRFGFAVLPWAWTLKAPNHVFFPCRNFEPR